MEGRTITFFTDGSCQHSNSPTTRHAGFAVVADVATHPMHRQTAVAQFRRTGQQPTTLVTLVAAFLQGEQDIHRAELAGVVYTCERFSNTHVLTDSQITLYLATRCLEGEPLSAFAMMDNYDLIERLWTSLKHGRRSFQKIKAHETLEQIPDTQVYPHLGNKQAKDAAIDVTTNAAPQFQAILARHHKHITAHQQRLKELFQFHLSAHRQRALAEAQAKGQARVDTPARQIDRIALAEYAVHSPWTPKTIRVHQLGDFAGGLAFAKIILQWAQQLKWPSGPDQHDLQDLGITWAELAISFMCTMQIFIPVARQVQAGHQELFMPLTIDEVKAHHIRLSDISEMFSVLVYQVAEFLDVEMWPPVPKRMIRSLYVQGALQQTHGYIWRPEIPSQQQVTQAMDRYLRRFRSAAFDGFPDIRVHPDATLVTQLRKDIAGDWKARCQTASIKRRKMKTLKRRMEGQQPLVFRWHFA